MLYRPASAEVNNTPSHIITSEQRIRVTFSAHGAGAATPGRAIREVLERTYRGVAFQVRWRTSNTPIRPSWIECVWTTGPNEAEAQAVIEVALRRLQVQAGP